MKRRIELDLTLFDGGAAGSAGAAGEAGAGAAGGTAGVGAPQGGVVAAGSTGAAGGQEAGATGGKDSVAELVDPVEPGTEEPTKEKTPEERRKEYERLIKGDFKDLYGEDVQKAINRRYANNQQLQQQLDSYKPLLELLSTKYSVGNGNVDEIMKAIDQDTTFFEEQAMKEGMSVEAYKKYAMMQAQNKAMEEAQRRAQQIRQKEETYARWDQEAETCRQQHPEFDMESEINNNPDFVRLLGAGADVTTAYRATHFNDIAKKLMTDTEKGTKKQVADTVRAGAARPMEAAGGKIPGKASVNISSMSKSEFMKFRNEVLAGRATLS